MPVYQQPGASTVAIGTELSAKLASLSGIIPQGVVFHTWYNQGTLVSDAVSSVRDAIPIGIGLAAVVLFVFLRSWKITLIGILVVPVVLAVTGLLLSVLGMALHSASDFVVPGLHSRSPCRLRVPVTLLFTNWAPAFCLLWTKGDSFSTTTPPGTALTETDRVLRQVEIILETMPEVLTYSRRTGLGLGGSLTKANSGDFFVRLKPLPRRAIDKVMADVRSRIKHTVPGITIEMSQPLEDLIGDLTAVPQPIEIKPTHTNF